MEKVLVFIFLLTAVLSGFAYNTTNHEAITQQAIYLLNNTYCPDFISEDEAKMIIKGNVSEDANVFKGIIRVFNQHFYNPLKDEKHRKRFSSIDKRFERIAKRWLIENPPGCTLSMYVKLCTIFRMQQIHHMRCRYIMGSM